MPASFKDFQSYSILYWVHVFCIGTCCVHCVIIKQHYTSCLNPSPPKQIASQILLIYHKLVRQERLAQLVRSLHSNNMVSSSIPGSAEI